MKTRYFVIFAFFIVLAFAFVACEGPAGKSGINLLPDDLLAPTVEIIHPPGGADVYDQVFLEAVVDDDGVIDRVEFIIDGIEPPEPALTVAEFPYSLIWVCDTLAAGEHFVQAVAWDDFGRNGMSQRITLVKRPLGEMPAADSIAYFNPAVLEADLTPTREALEWFLPDYRPEFSGFAVRFTHDRPGLLQTVGINVIKDESWVGRIIDFEVRTTYKGMPDSLLGSFQFNIRRVRLFPTNGWISVRAGSLPVPEEFFVLVTAAEDAEGDTIVVFSDDGGWRDHHSLVRVGGEWQSSTSLMFKPVNPLLYASIRNR